MKRMLTSVLSLLVLANLSLAGEPRDPLLVGLGSASPEARRDAALLLTELREGAVPILIEGLASDDLVAALACADLLGEGAWRRSREPLRSILEDEDSPRLLRRACCRALGKAGDYRDVKLLGSLLPEFPEAALALIDIGEVEAVLPLQSALDGGVAFPEVPYAIAMLDGPGGVDALLEMLTGSDRIAARHYLRRLAGADFGEDVAGWQRWRAREIMANDLGSGDWDASEQAMADIASRIEAGETGLRDDLMLLARETTRPINTRTKALLLIGLLGDAAAGPALVEILNNDPEGLVRVYAAEAIGRVGYAPAAVDLAWYLVFDEEEFRKLSARNSRIRYFTIDSEVSKALVRMGFTGGLDYLIRQIEQEHRVRVYHQALSTLRATTGQNFGYRPDARRAEREMAAKRWRLWFDEHRAEIEIAGNADLSDPVFRRRVAGLVDTLGHYKFLTMSRARSMLVLLGEVALPEIVAGLSRDVTHIRVHCAEILGWIHAKSARRALACALDDPRPEVRTAAMVALADMGPGQEVPAVLKALEDDSPDMRIEAVRALARVQAARAVPIIKRALKAKRNASETFRREAWFALGVHGIVEAVDRLATLLDVPDAASRQKTADRLLVLTGRDPGVEAATIAAWKAWWEVSRNSYSPQPVGGRPGNDVTER